MRRAEFANSLNYIPPIITTTCILFYHEDEIFEVTAPSMELSEDAKRLRQLQNTTDAAANYGLNEISSGQVLYARWDIKILYIDKSNACKIGLISERNDKYDFHLFRSDGAMYKPNGRTKWFDYGHPLKKGDILSICLDFQEIRFMINDKDQGAAYTMMNRPGTKYQLTVALDHMDTSVEIVNFEKRYIPKYTRGYTQSKSFNYSKRYESKWL